MRRVLVLCLLLGGCAAKPLPEPVIITKTVQVPIAVPCKVQLPQEPVLPSKSADLSGDAFDLAKLALMDRAELQAALARWQAAARACAS